MGHWVGILKGNNLSVLIRGQVEEIRMHKHTEASYSLILKVVIQSRPGSVFKEQDTTTAKTIHSISQHRHTSICITRQFIKTEANRAGWLASVAVIGRAQ